MDELNKLFNRVYKQAIKNGKGEATEEEKEELIRNLVSGMDKVGIDIEVLLMYINDIDNILYNIQETDVKGKCEIVVGDSKTNDDSISFEGNYGGLLRGWMVLSDSITERTQGVMNKEMLLALLLCTNVAEGGKCNEENN